MQFQIFNKLFIEDYKDIIKPQIGNGTCQVKTFQNGSFRFVSGSCQLIFWNVSKGGTKRLNRVNWWHGTIDTCQTLTRHEKFVSTRV